MADRFLLERYQILEKLGQGGFGEVFKAFDTKMRRLVAIKRMDASQKASARALKEARAAAKLDHPNVVSVHDLEKDAEYYYLVMEFVDGVTLAEILEAKPRLSVEESIDIAIQIAEALEVAHLKGVIHRDIKPENIMLSKDGAVKVADFGIAHLASSTMTKEGDILGTFAYMSPEQAKGGRIDHKTDVFSLGVVLYQMLTGEAPFAAATPGGIVFKVLNLEPQPVSELNETVGEELEALVSDALAKERKDRLPDATRFYQRLEVLRQGKVSSKRMLRPLYKMAKRRRSFEEALPGQLDWAVSGFSRFKLAVRDFSARHQSFMERIFDAVLIGLAVWYLLSRTTFYPAPLRLALPLVVLIIVFALPRLGIPIGLTVLVLPIANFSLILALFYMVILVLYGLSFLLVRPVKSVFTLGAPMLTRLGVGLAFPLLSGLAWAPLQAFAIGAVGGLVSEMVDLLGGRYVRYIDAPNTYRLLNVLGGEINPWTALKGIVHPFIDSPTLILQPLLWASVALIVSLLVKRTSLKRDLLGLAAAAGVFLIGQLVLLTRFNWGVGAIDALMQTFVLSLIIALGFLLILPREKPKETAEEAEEYEELIVG